MKPKFALSLIIIFMSAAIYAQDNSQAVHLAHKFAKKMKDSLDLSAQQRQQIFQVNMDLHDEKQAVRQQNPPPDSLQVRVQRLEMKRDSLYLPILSNEKYQLYLQKKRNLVNNN